MLNDGKNEEEEEFEDNSEMENEDVDPEEDSAQNTSKIRKPPSLVRHDKINDHKAFVQLIKQSVKDKFYIKYHEDNTEVFLHNKTDYVALGTVWKNKDIKFHTYASKEEKRRTNVIKGMHAQTKPEEIKDNLEEEGIVVLNVNLIKGTVKLIFMVSTVVIAKLNSLKQKMHHICYTKVDWDNYIKKRRLAQCQKWGHATTNCYADPACLKCAGEHLTKDCKKPRCEPAKCANCNKDHPGNATIGDTYKRRLDMIGKRQEKAKTRSKEQGIQHRDLELDDKKQFPELRPTPGALQAWNRNDTVNIIPRSRESQKVTEVTMDRQKVGSDLNDFLILTEEIKQLNTKFNVKSMLKSVKSLNEKLEHCSQIEEFQVFVEFC